ncbi:xanthine permease XanP [Tatumella morbirosei]|uniref:Xanthine permease XanP n=1 Tax=Tatumella morbirosei TaxID=642227 RepID=A0A095U6W3_9GAMM|nr:nucleobase:cation symporter-2 family protein [Tatumella morbirosei]KGD70333.1 xanthine permease XanP [Tatumella morbirosei]
MNKTHETGLLYGLNEKIPTVPAIFTAIQHMLASIVGIITPPLIIGSTLGLNAYMPYLISMSLFASGLGTILQAGRFFSIGAGMICLQGTSFAFLGVIISGGMMIKGQGGTPEQILAMIFGCNLVAAIIPLIVSRFIHTFSRLLTPLVTGSVIVLIGISLIKVSISDWGGGFGAADFGSPRNLGLGALTLIVIVLMNCSRSPWLRLSGIVTGIVVGSVAAWLTGSFHPQFSSGGQLLTVPVPFRFGVAFNLSVFIPIALVSLISIIEAVGDLTANCMLSKQPVEGPEFEKRIKGGILGDGVSCILAAAFSSFPNTTFAQNNGVIQMTQVASRYAGFWIGGIFVLLGLFPMFSHVLEQLPPPVLGGATLVMFGNVVAAGIRIMTRETIDNRGMLIIAISFGVGLGIEAQPDVIKELPAFIRTLLQSAVTSGGILAILLNLVLPRSKHKPEVNTHTHNESSSSISGETHV